MKTIDVTAATFDLDKLTGRDMSELAKAEKAIDIETLASIVAKVVTSLPGAAAVNDPNTYLDMPFVQLMKLLKRMGQILSGELSA